MVNTYDKIAGSVYGLAFGDAWGYITEFHSHADNIKRKPEPPELLVISDDTQMSIYNMLALQKLQYTGWLTPNKLEQLPTNVIIQNHFRSTFADEYVNFYYDKDNTRAPGRTVMQALTLYIKATRILETFETTGQEGGDNQSKGCGANMRSPWLGLLPYSREQIALLSILQAQATHGHPTAWVAAAVTALIVHGLFNNLTTPHSLFSYALTCVEEIVNIQSNLTQNISLGVTETREGLLKSAKNLPRYLNQPDDVDLNLYFGEGWIAEEALFNGIAAIESYPTDYRKAIQSLVYTNGDSDSIAAIGGSFWGAYNGFKSLTIPIVEKLEPRYKAELSHTVEWLNQLYTPTP